MNDFRNAFDDVSASSSGGAPFLLAYGTTFLAAGVLAFFLEAQFSALVAIFQGFIALPTAFLLEQKFSLKRPVKSNPLIVLSGQLAFSQILGLPLLIVVYGLNPDAIPVVLSSLAGIHLLPYAWLQRTKLYIILAGVVALAGLLLFMFVVEQSFQLILLFVGFSYLLASPYVFWHSRRILQVDTGRIS